MNIDAISGTRPVRMDAGAGVQGAASIKDGRDVGETDDFSKLLGETIVEVAQQIRQAEAVSIAGIKGTASTQDVVEQVMRAEQTLQAAIAIRDKVVSAYLEISRMQI